MADLDSVAPASKADLAGWIPDLAISPAGRVYLETGHGDADTPASAAATRIAKAFARSGAHGLLQLGAVELSAALRPALAQRPRRAHPGLVEAAPTSPPAKYASGGDQASG